MGHRESPFFWFWGRPPTPHVLAFMSDACRSGPARCHFWSCIAPPSEEETLPRHAEPQPAFPEVAILTLAERAHARWPSHQSHTRTVASPGELPYIMPALLRRPTPHLEAKEGVWCEKGNDVFIVLEIAAPYSIWHASPAWLSFTGFLPSDGKLSRIRPRCRCHLLLM